MVVSLILNHAIILFILWLNVQIDKYQISKGETINHEVEMGIFSGIIFMCLTFNIMASGWLYLAYILHYFALRLLLFDRIINNALGYPKHFLGDTAWTDRKMKVLRKYGFEPIVRVGAVMLSGFFVLGESVACFLSESQENVLAWSIFVGMLSTIVYAIIKMKK